MNQMSILNKLVNNQGHLIAYREKRLLQLYRIWIVAYVCFLKNNNLDSYQHPF